MTCGIVFVYNEETDSVEIICNCKLENDEK
jgi:hypothetical protein